MPTSDDPLANLRLTEPDFAWATAKIAEVADKHAQGRLVSMLEGGYNLAALAKSVAVHVKALMDAGTLICGMAQPSDARLLRTWTMAKPAAKHADIKDMSFESALKELETIVGRLERGDVELEESINIYERGEALKEHCDRLLKQAEAKVEKLTFNQAGEPDGHRAFQAAGVNGPWSPSSSTTLSARSIAATHVGL